jgi:pimeloyl-ACP methyl ester carboxylesterase
MPLPAALGFPGPCETAMIDLRTALKDPEISVYYPVSDPPLAELPVVIFTTGWNQPRISYASYGTQLAQWGYVAVVRSYPTLGFEGMGNLMYDEHLAHISAILDMLAQENERTESPLFGMVDATNAAAVGYSQGAGYSLAAPLYDSRIKAVVSIDIPPTGAEVCTLAEILPDSTAKTMFISAEWYPFDVSKAAGWPHLIDCVSKPTLEVTVTNASHSDFADFFMGLSVLAELLYPQGNARSEDVRAIATRYTVSWLNVHMKGLVEFEAYYAGEGSEQDIADELVKILYRMDDEAAR